MTFIETSISIITPCLNRKDLIETAIESVHSQRYDCIEHIIMDGGSTDGTLELLEAYPHLKVFSQRDKSLYDALNHGIELAGGEILGFLNTDDFYGTDIFPLVMDYFKMDPELDAVVGEAVTFKIGHKNNPVIVLRYPAITSDTLIYRIAFGNPTLNAWFFRKRFVEKVGRFDLAYKIASDRDWMIRAALNKPKFASLDKLIYHYRQHPESLTIDGVNDAEAEYNFESQAIALKYIESTPQSEPLNRYLKAWHSDICSGQVIAAIRKHKPKSAIAYMKNGLTHHKLWPYYFLRRIAAGAVRRIQYSELDPG